MNVLIVCTSNKDRSPALVEYCESVFPKHSYRSAGINRYFCAKKKTHLITTDDLKWCNLIVFCENIHLQCVKDNFILSTNYKQKDGRISAAATSGTIHGFCGEKMYQVLNCGEYKQGCVGDDYMQKADMKLEKLLTASDYF